MKIQMLAFILAAVVSSMALAQGADQFEAGVAEAGVTQPNQTQMAAQAKVVQAQNSFGGKLFGEVSKSDKSNTFLSPISASLALSMATSGARGETAAAMEKALQLNNLSPQDMNLGNATLMKSLSQTGDGFTIQIANSIWIKQGFAVYPAFITNAQQSYQAEVQNLDFQSPTASKTINDWVSLKTHNKITSIVPDKLPQDSQMFLINATYLKADWLNPFKAALTRNDSFNVAVGSPKQVKMMGKTDSFSYVEDADYQAVELPYKGETASMLVILPKDGKFDSVGQSLSQNLVGVLSDSLAKKEAVQYGALELPKFTISTEMDLVPSLKALGMGLAFSGNADFGALSSSHVNISSVKQKVFIAVDENGTEAAAVTSIGFTLSAVRPPSSMFKMLVNRPFYVVIKDKASGAILFEGRVMDPAP